MWQYSSFISSASEASCVYLQVKRVMNGVFHSLRGEFDLSESYSGQAVLEVIVSTIKVSMFAINFQSSLSGMSGKKLHLITAMFCNRYHLMQL